MAPWIFLLFLAIFDFGFYAYAAISTAHAARVAVLYTSSSISSARDQTTACMYALGALRDLPNIGSTVNACTAQGPVQVTVAPPATATDQAYGITYSVSTVSVTYHSLPLFPIPWLMGQMTITRKAQMRIPS
jgi:hypothetical protein